MIEAAVQYAARGWSVIPLKERTKNQPLTPEGFKDASAEPGVIAAWWAHWPTANIAVAIEASGLLLVDFDPRNKAAEWKHKWPAQDYDDLLERCEQSATLSATTGSGGRHFLFKAPAELPRLRSLLASGVDFKHNGYFVAAPSIHPDTGEEYAWDTNPQFVADGAVNPLPLPDWLRAMAEVVEEDLPEPRAPQNPNDLRPGTQFNALASMSEILTPHGWTLVRKDGEEEFWCRPGKTDSIGATFNFENCGLFYVFTTSTEFTAERGYDKLGVYAILNHGGDVDAAIAEIRDVWLPQQATMDLTDEDLGLFFKDTAPAVEDPTAAPWEHVFAPGHFVTRYIEHATRQTSASPSYHEAAALSLLAIATHQVRAHLAPYPGGLKTNLYLCLVGASSRTYKSTSQDIMLGVLRRYREGSILPAKSSTESMVDQLASASGISKVWTPDEFGMAISEIGRRDHLKGIEDLLLELYGNKRYDYQTLSRGLVTIQNSHLSVFGASAPETLALGGATAMLGGLLPRFGIIFPRSLPPYRKVQESDAVSAEKANERLARALRLVQEVVQEHPVVEFSSEAMVALNAAEERLMTEGLHGARLPTMLYKVAMLAAMGAETPHMLVTEEDAQSAVAVIDRWSDGARHLQPYLRRKAEDLEFERRITMTLEVLDEFPNGTAPRWQLARKLRWPKQRLDQIMSALVDQALIRVDDAGNWIKR